MWETVQELEKFVGDHIADEPAGVLDGSEAKNFITARVQAFCGLETEMKSRNLDHCVADLEFVFFLSNRTDHPGHDLGKSVEAKKAGDEVRDGFVVVTSVWGSKNSARKRGGSKSSVECGSSEGGTKNRRATFLRDRSVESILAFGAGRTFDLAFSNRVGRRKRLLFQKVDLIVSFRMPWSVQLEQRFWNRAQSCQTREKIKLFHDAATTIIVVVLV